MRLPRKTLILLVALPLFGMARLHYEDHLTKHLREQRLLSPKLNIGTLDHIGQTSAAISIGGLRTLVATFLNLRAYSAFSERRWSDLEKDYRTIYDLAPHTPYYWDTGSWHLAYNAAASHVNDDSRPPLRRREAWRESIHKGRAMLEDGIRNNPQSTLLLNRYATLLTDPFKIRAFPDPQEAFLSAADAFERSAKAGNKLAPRFALYAMARVPEKQAEALSVAQRLYDEGVRNRTPSLLCTLFALKMADNPTQDPKTLAIRVFGSAENAMKYLPGYWTRANEYLPEHGVAEAIRLIEQDLQVPPEKSALLEPMVPPYDPIHRMR